MGVRSHASTLGVTYSAVARAERGDPALESLAKKSVIVLLHEPARPGEVSDVGAAYGDDSLPLSANARAHVKALLKAERGWRRALVRGVMEEHGYVVETDHATATARFPNVKGNDEEGDHSVLQFSLDEGFVDATVKGTTTRLRPFITNPFERADRASWGADLEQLAALYRPGDTGWARRDEDFDPLDWVIDADDATTD